MHYVIQLTHTKGKPSKASAIKELTSKSTNRHVHVLVHGRRRLGWINIPSVRRINLSSVVSMINALPIYWMSIEQSIAYITMNWIATQNRFPVSTFDKQRNALTIGFTPFFGT
jgi:hypothetical protein